MCVCVSQDRDYFLAEQVGFITETSGTYWVVHTESLNVSESPPPTPVGTRSLTLLKIVTSQVYSIAYRTFRTSKWDLKNDYVLHMFEITLYICTVCEYCQQQYWRKWHKLSYCSRPYKEFVSFPNMEEPFQNCRSQKCDKR